MIRNLLALVLVSFIVPVPALAETAGVACNLVNQETLVALKLGDHRMKAERKQVPSQIAAKPNTVDTCIYAPRNGTSPTLTVTTAELPTGAQTLKPSCSEIPSVALEFALCTAAVRNTFVTFTLATKPSPGASMKSQFPAQIERLVLKLAKSAAPRATSK